MFECCSIAEKARVMADNRWVLGIEVGHTRHAGKAQSPIYGARYQSAQTDSTIILAHSQHTHSVLSQSPFLKFLFFQNQRF